LRQPAVPAKSACRVRPLRRRNSNAILRIIQTAAHWHDKEHPMLFDRHQPTAGSQRLAWLMALACVVVFALGAVIGYHSIYRNVAVAMLPPPPPATSPY